MPCLVKASGHICQPNTYTSPIPAPQHTLKNLEILEIGIFSIDIELHAAHRKILCAQTRKLSVSEQRFRYQRTEYAVVYLTQRRSRIKSRISLQSIPIYNSGKVTLYHIAQP